MDIKEKTVALAPLAGVSDKTMRTLCIEYGAQLCVTEMISAKAVCYGDKKTLELADIGDAERPCSLQLFGSEPDIMAKAAEKMLVFSPAAIDINMGCPVGKIVKNGEGSALMKNPALAAEIVKAVKRAVDIPVTVKFRSGFDKEHINAVDFAKVLCEAGADMLCIHGRTREQMYSGKADRSIMAAVKAASSVPVLANGDVFSPEDAKSILEETGCDGVMVARGALGAPYIFSQIKEYLATGEYKIPSEQEKLMLAMRHIRMLVAHKGKHIGIMEARKHLAWYIKGMNGCAKARDEINRATSIAQFEQILNNI